MESAQAIPLNSSVDGNSVARFTNAKKTTWRLASVVLGLLLLGGCATTHPEFGAIAPEATAERMPFLRDGVTTRVECLARLGPARAAYEEDNSLVYVIYGSATGQVSQQFFMSGDMQQADRHYDLVLSFDAQGVLRRHTLMQKLFSQDGKAFSGP